MELVVALLPGICWGVFPILTFLIGGDIKKQVLGSSIGAFIGIIILNIINNYNYDLTTVIVGFVTGCFWPFGLFYQFKTAKLITMAKTAPLSSGTQLIFSTLFSVIVFREWETKYDFIVGIISMLLIIVGMYMTGYTENKAHFSKDTYIQAIKCVLLSSLLFVVYIVGVQLFPQVDKMTVLLPQIVGIIVGAIINVGIKQVPKEVDKKFFLFIIPGLVWLLGNASLLVSYNRFGVAVSFGLAQTTIVISTLGSIYILKERKTQKEFKRVLLGLTILMFGVILLLSL